jgi:PKD repeat protein
MTLTKHLVILAAAAALGGCGLSNEGAPGLAGPSELGLSVAVTATPDTLTQDGVSQSIVGITARDASGQPVAGMDFRVDIVVDGNSADFGVLSTKAVSTAQDGTARVTYTAPPKPAPSVTNDSTVNIMFTPAGCSSSACSDASRAVVSDYANTVSRSVALHLVRPGVITPPSSGLVASFAMSPDSPIIGDDIVFDASASVASGNRTITSYSWNFGDGRTASGKLVSHHYSDPGTYAVTLTVTDDLGRQSAASKSLTLGANAPTAAILFSPSDPSVGQAVHFNGLTSAPAVGRTIEEYHWNFGDGKPDATGPTPEHTFDESGTYNVTLTVVDDLGQEKVASASVTVKDISATFTVSPTSPTTGTVVNFNASQSKAAGGATIASYAWDFGDGGTSSSGPTTTHTYTTAGTYTVVLTITDSLGHKGSVSQTVTVQ